MQVVEVCTYLRTERTAIHEPRIHTTVGKKKLGYTILEK
jgi:hypothetical protein